MRVLGVDPSLRSTGFGVIESDGHRFALIEYGRVRARSGESHGDSLARIETELGAVIGRTEPGEAAIESLFFCRNVRTAITLGEARGAVLAVLARSGVPVVEYAPRRVKQSVAGRGAAAKQQVALLVRRLLGIREELPEDASDALAVAICHVHHATAPAALRTDPAERTNRPS